MVIVEMQVEVLPLLSVAVTVTMLGPISVQVKAVSLKVIAGAPQASPEDCAAMLELIVAFPELSR